MSQLELLKFINELDKLKNLAELRKNRIIDNGREVPIVERAKAEGYVDAYSFVIMKLNNFIK